MSERKPLVIKKNRDMSFDHDLSCAAKAILNANSLAILSHTGPDADAYGSMCGLALALKDQGKKVSCFNEAGAMEKYTFIPGVEEVSDSFSVDAPFDLLVVCDCGDRKRMGDIFAPLATNHSAPLLNIDHHSSNELFGDFNLVSVTHSSTSEIVCDLLSALKFTLSAKAATALLAGIVGDTGSFRYSCTSSRTLATASQLVASGGSLVDISKELYGSYPLSMVRLQANVLLNMKMHHHDEIAGIVVSKELFDQYGASADDADMLVERARDIQGVKISYAARQVDDLWKVSLRSVNDQYDVAQVAQCFGGGGHKAAAAFRTRKDFRTLEESLVTKLSEVLDGA